MPARRHPRRHRNARGQLVDQLLRDQLFRRQRAVVVALSTASPPPPRPHKQRDGHERAADAHYDVNSRLACESDEPGRVPAIRRRGHHVHDDTGARCSGCHEALQLLGNDIERGRAQVGADGQRVGAERGQVREGGSRISQLLQLEGAGRKLPRKLVEEQLLMREYGSAL